MMFLVRRPSVEATAGFLHQSEKASLSYGQPGILRLPSAAHGIREWTYALGRGNADFERARNALAEWKHFTHDVIYRIRATSRPQAALARIGRPVVRILQARFRNESAAAMRHAISSQEVRP